MSVVHIRSTEEGRKALGPRLERVGSIVPAGNSQRTNVPCRCTIHETASAVPFSETRNANQTVRA